MSEARQYIFLGAGDLAREVAQLARSVGQAAGQSCRIVYFTDDGQTIAEDRATHAYHDQNVLLRDCPPEQWQVVVCVGRPSVRQRLFDSFGRLGYSFASIIADQTTIESDRIGPGTVIFAGSRVAIGATIGQNVLISYNVVVGHDTHIGDHSVLNPGVGLGGHVAGGRAVLYGIGCSVLQGRRVGDNAVISAGSSAWTDVPADQTVMGIPAAPCRIPGKR